jgi:hypothetical protein
VNAINVNDGILISMEHFYKLKIILFLNLNSKIMQHKYSSYAS